MKMCRFAPLAAALGWAVSSAHAADFNARDFFTAPAGTHLGVTYLPITRADTFRSPLGNDHNAKLAVTGLVHREVWFKEFAGVMTTPQFVVSALDVNVRGPGAAKRTRQTGVGDPLVGGTVYFINHPDSRTFMGWLNLVALPLGKYDRNDPGSSPGNNRWELHSALNFTRGIGDKWVLESALEVQAYGKNDKYFTQELKQEPLVRLQSFASYDIAPATTAALRLVYAEGGQLKLAGNTLAGTRQRYVQLGFEFSHMVGPKDGLMFSYNRNVEARNTFLQNDVLLRWVHIY